MKLASATWPDVAAVAATTVLVIPLGSTEQHGPHLPLSTDTEVAVALANRLDAARSDVAVAPALAYGSAGEHAGFPGTLSIGQAALGLVVVELVRSADDFAAVVIVCGHGGNVEPLTSAVDTLRQEGRRVLAWTPHHYVDAHAGRSETSLLLALDAGRVQLDAAESGATQPLSELEPMLRAAGVRAVSPNGVLGDPSGASADEGRLLLDAMGASLIDEVEKFLA
jgi:mycofactocin system creatininase family protein